MQIWRVHLESDREYPPDKIKVPAEDSISKLDFAKQIDSLDQVAVNENKLLEALLRDREKEVVEVVSVNMGKKKKRIKKGAELEASPEKTVAAPTTSGGAKKAGTSSSSAAAKKPVTTASKTKK